MQGGDAFRVSKHTRFKNRHVYFILSDTERDPNNVVTANLASDDPNEDPSCILEAGDHRCVTHRTCIRYTSAGIRSVEKINKAIRLGLVTQPPPASASMLVRMREGAGCSKFLPQECRDFLEAQGLIGPR